MGSPEFGAAQQMLCEQGKDQFMATLEGRSEALIDEWQTEMLLKPLRRGSIKLFTEQLGETELAHIFVDHITDLQQAVLESVREHDDTDIAIIPEGPYVVPRYIHS